MRARIHPRWKTPAFAVVASCAWAAILALSGTFEQLLAYVVFTGWAFYALGAAAIFYYRRSAPDAPRPFRVPGYPWTPLVFICVAAAIVRTAKGSGHNDFKIELAQRAILRALKHAAHQPH